MPPSAHGDNDHDAPWALYGAVSTPMVVTDRDGLVVFLNMRAEAFWGVRLADIQGRNAWSALGLGPVDGSDQPLWVRSVLSPTLASEPPVLSRAKVAAGSEHRVELSGFWATHRGQPFVVLTASEVRADVLVGRPHPHQAERDALTGLPTLRHLQRVAAEWNGRNGTVVFFDLDGLREINDLRGQAIGDRALASVGRALASEMPSGALAVRCGDDEFVLLLDGPDAARAADIAGRVTARVAAEGAEALPLQLDHGIAVFAPGDLEPAVRRANDALREQRGVLMRGASGGRILLTRAARHRLQGPSAEPEERAAQPLESSIELDLGFRDAFTRAAGHAREFVGFVAPEAGAAVVEVGAGSGRITFDGDLAERVGPQGQLLITDPSARRLAAARWRAFDLGLYWVRFLQAPVEDLPVASGTADLVLGSTFLHWTDPEAALRAMARVVRPGGRVAVNATLNLTWGAAWAESMVPVVREVGAYVVRTDGPALMGRHELEAAFRAAGLRIDEVHESGRERAVFANAEVALIAARKGGMVALQFREVAEERRSPVRHAVEAAIRQAFGRPRSADDTAWDADTISIVAHRPE